MFDKIKLIKKKYFYTLAILLSASLVAFKNEAKILDDKFVSIGTGNITGIYYPAGAAICKLVNKFKKEHFIRCSVESTSGSMFNIQALKSKQQDLAIIQSDYQYFAYNGVGGFENNAVKNLRSIFSLHTDAFTVVVRADSGIRSFEDLKGKRINLGSIGSGSRGVMELLIDLYGWSKNDFALIKEYKPSEQPEALCNNKIDAMIYTVGHPNGAVQEAVSSCETIILPVEGEKIQQLISKHPYYTEASIPGNMYAGNHKNINTFGVKATLVALDNLDDNIVYNIVKSVFDNVETFKTLHPVFNNLNIDDMVTEGNTAPMHSGAKKYFQEKKMLKLGNN
ncbi:MAG: TAXI family TRAP transporter solute-binding subunit [Alphaproteobacteria bacterium]